MQVKSKQRVADHGEVFTNEREVKAMVDLVWDEFYTDDRKIAATFLEPACGSGNFLVEILQRKLEVLKNKYRKDRTGYERNLMVAVGSIYGVELLEDNAEECRERLYNLVEKAIPKSFATAETFPELLKSIRYILSCNIICGNALDYTTRDGEPIIFTHWSLQLDGKVIMHHFDYREISNVKDGMASLFGELQQDNPPPATHYLKLYTHDTE